MRLIFLLLPVVQFSGSGMLNDRHVAGGAVAAAPTAGTSCLAATVVSGCCVLAAGRAAGTVATFMGFMVPDELVEMGVKTNTRSFPRIVLSSVRCQTELGAMSQG